MIPFLSLRYSAISTMNYIKYCETGPTADIEYTAQVNLSLQMLKWFRLNRKCGIFQYVHIMKKVFLCLYKKKSTKTYEEVFLYCYNLNTIVKSLIQTFLQMCLYICLPMNISAEKNKCSVNDSSSDTIK